jgi:hypothetical protein
MLSSEKCFKLTIRCGVEALDPECPYFETLAEQAIMNAVKVSSSSKGAPRLFLLVAQQGTGKSALAERLYGRIMREADGVLPLVLCGKEDLSRQDFLEKELENAIQKALYEWVKLHRGVEKLPSNCDIRSLIQFSYVMEVAGLRLFLIVDEARLIGGASNVGKFLEGLRVLEDKFAFAGLLLMFQDLTSEEHELLLRQISGRGGSRWLWDGDVLTHQDLLPQGEEIDRVRKWAAQILGDAVAAAVYSRISAELGFRAANIFALTFLRPSGKVSLTELHNSIVKALSEKYRLPREQAVGGCRADLVIGSVPADVKLCTDTDSFIKAFEEDRRKGCNFEYIVIGHLNEDLLPDDARRAIRVPLRVDVQAIASGLTAVSASMHLSSDTVFTIAAGAIADLIDLRDLGVTGEVSRESLLPLLEELCTEIEHRGGKVSRTELVRLRNAKSLAARLGISLARADDANRLVQRVQQLGLGLTLEREASYVRCSKQRHLPSWLGHHHG